MGILPEAQTFATTWQLLECSLKQIKCKLGKWEKSIDQNDLIENNVVSITAPSVDSGDFLITSTY